MVAIGLCVLCCGGEIIPGMPMTVSHCYGQGDRPAPPGVFGGFMCSCECREAKNAPVDDLSEDVCERCGSDVELDRPNSLYMDGQFWGEIVCPDCLDK